MTTLQATTAVVAKVVPDGGDFNAVNWSHWGNVEPDRMGMIPLEILTAWLRQRGGVHPGDELGVTVYYYDADTPLYDNGQPTSCSAIRFDIT